MRDLRRLASLFVLMVAVLASLATSRPAYADSQVDGRTEVGPDGALLSVAVALSGLGSSGYDYGSADSKLQFQVNGGAGQGSTGLASSLQVQIVGPGGDPATAPWTSTPAEAPLALDICATSCTLDFEIHLKTVHPGGDPVVVPWRVYAIAFGDVGKLEITVVASQMPSPMTDAAAWFMGIGFALALAVALVLAAAGKRLRSRAAVLEALAAVTLIGAGAVVARGLFAGLESGAAGLIEVVAGVAVGLGLALRRPFLSRPSYWIIPVAMVAAPVMLARFVVGGEFRVSDVAAAFIAVGVVMAIALILAAPPLRRTLARLRLRQPRTLLVLAIAAIGIGVAASWAVLISAGATRVSVIAAVPFGAIYVALSIALWRWLKGDSITSFTVGLVTPLGAAGAAGAVLVALIGSLFSAGPATPFVFESIAAIGLCGILFAVLTIQPPRRGDPGAPKGRAMQFRWEDDEIARPSPSVSPPVAPVS